MIGKIKEWQSFISLAVFLVTCTAAVVAYKSKVDSNEQKLSELLVKIEQVEQKIADEFDAMGKRTDDNFKYITTVHMLLLEVKGDVKALKD